MFKEGNLIRRITDDGDGEIKRVLEDSSTGGTTYVATGNDDDREYITTSVYELVAESQVELEKTKNPQPVEEQTVAIVSFEGAIKREVGAIRNALSIVDTISSFSVNVSASGRTDDGEVEIVYEIEGSKYNDGVKGNNMRECLSEFMRRHGWDHANKPLAISYDGIPV